MPKRVQNENALLNWSWEKGSDVQAAVTSVISIETEDEGLRVDVRLTPEQVSHLLSGTVLQVNARVVRAEVGADA